jgi:RNA polymerase sigma factor (sigma-70 family)
LLRLRSDEQLVSLFRAGNDEAFRAIHDRYRARMLAYTRQMLTGSIQDPEDAVQEIFVRAYAGLRANRRQLALRAWLYRIAHNRCIDELRRPHAVALETVDYLIPAAQDPVAKVEQRDSLRRLIIDVQRLPEQQRSALLMRELAGMPYADVAGALGVSVAAVKSLLVRARMGLAQASEARDTACAQIREDLIASHDRGVRSSGLARRHLRDCPNCRQFRSEVRCVSRRFAALVPTLGPIGVLANLIGWGSGGGAAATGGAVSGGAAAAGSGAAAASAGALAGATGHVVTILAAALVATGGAVEIQHIAGPTTHPRHHVGVTNRQARPAAAPLRVAASVPVAPVRTSPQAAPTSAPPVAAAPVQTAPAPAPRAAASGGVAGTSGGQARHNRAKAVPLSQTLDPDRMMFTPKSSSTTSPSGDSTSTGSTSTGGSSSSTTPVGGTDATLNPTAGGTTGAEGTGAAGSTGSGAGSTGAASGSGGSTTGATSGGAGTGGSSSSTASETGAGTMTTFGSQGQ